MNLRYKISLTLNLLFLAGVIYLAFNGKCLVKNFFFKYVIQVRHEQKLSMFRAAPVSKGAVIFLGNSITEGGNWSELFHDKNILNRGIGGDVSDGVLKRIDEVIRHQPSKLFICIGTNDIAKGVSQEGIIQNYRAILETVKSQSPETKIYVQSLFPVGKDLFTGHNNYKVRTLNAELSNLCSNMNVAYIDLYPSFTDETGYLNPEYSNDKLHLMGNGYLLWKSLIEKYINE
jgi:lysophospholipase L1-like esterase